MEVDKSEKLKDIDDYKPVRFTAFGEYLALSYKEAKEDDGIEKVIVYDIKKNSVFYTLIADKN